MTDYISREDAIDAVCGWGPNDLTEAIRADIETIPAADVRPEWVMIESRPMDAEERQYYSEQYGYELTDEEAVIYCSQLPEHGQEVLVCNKWGHIWTDTFDDDPDYGVGFEMNGDMDGLAAWMPLPKPPKEADDGRG